MRCMELDIPFALAEQSNVFGGLAASETDEHGFVWDYGGHVQFSHYSVFDKYMDTAIAGSKWLHHVRHSVMKVRDAYVDYPVQAHIEEFPDELRVQCAQELASISASSDLYSNFHDWLVAHVGVTITKEILGPYNTKIWTVPPALMNARWVVERVAEPAALSSQDAGNTKDWGPNHLFRYPSRGGTGAVWAALGSLLPPTSVLMNSKVTRIDTRTHAAILEDGRQIKWEHLISTMPVDQLCTISKAVNQPLVDKLEHSQTFLCGLGFAGPCPPFLREMSWMYFSDPADPYYRVTVLSNYSDANVPSSKCFSLLIEVAMKRSNQLVDAATFASSIEQRIRNEFGITSTTKTVSAWTKLLPYGYPIPTLHRDEIISTINEQFEQLEVFSRGRFGFWKYEISNQDHSFMQGYECIGRIHSGTSISDEPTILSTLA